MNRVAEPPHNVSPLSAEVAKVQEAKRYCQWCFWCSYSFDVVLVVVAVGRQSVQGKLLYRFRADWCFHFAILCLTTTCTWDVQIYLTLNLFMFLFQLNFMVFRSLEGQEFKASGGQPSNFRRWVDESMGWEVAMRRQEKWILCLLLPAPVTDTPTPHSADKEKTFCIRIVCEKKLMQSEWKDHKVYLKDGKRQKVWFLSESLSEFWMSTGRLGSVPGRWGAAVIRCGAVVNLPSQRQWRWCYFGTDASPVSATSGGNVDSFVAEGVVTCCILLFFRMVLHRFGYSNSGDRQLEPIFKALSALAAEAHSRPTPCRIFVASVSLPWMIHGTDLPRYSLLGLVQWHPLAMEWRQASVVRCVFLLNFGLGLVRWLSRESWSGKKVGKILSWPQFETVDREAMHVSAKAPRPAMAVPQGFALLLEQQVMATSRLEQFNAI